MASVFDALISQLLHDVALAGLKGLCAIEFENSVRKFCDGHNERSRDDSSQQSDHDLLFSDSPPVEAIFADDDLINSAFEWLHQNAKVLVQQQSDSGVQNTLSLSTNGTRQPSRLSVKLLNKVIRAPEERIWLELTGHDVDHSRIATLDFECLSTIAASGPNGILQKYIVQQTGQDKRSVPARTDRLAKGGYIVKESVVGEGARTSLCTLTKYKRQQASAESADASTQKKPVTKGGIIFHDVWFDSFIQILKQNNGSTTLDVARTELGIDASVGERRRFFQCVRRLVESGCLRIIKGKIQQSDPNGHWGASRYKRVQCVQLAREPTEEDREFFKKAETKVDRTSMTSGLGEKFGEHDAHGASDDDVDDVSAFNESTAPGSVGDVSRSEPSSHWTPTLPLHNQIVNLINGGGRRGLTARQLFTQIGSSLWTRPLDEVLARLTDVWHHSQPPHLRHLSIIRDTAMHGKTSVFHYRSFDQFREAVEAGEADWDAILGEAGKKGAEEKRKALAKTPELDRWGFPKIDPKTIQSDGRATLGQCKKGMIKYSSHDYNKTMIDNDDDSLSDGIDDENVEEDAEHSDAEKLTSAPKLRTTKKSKMAHKETPAKHAASNEVVQDPRDPGVYLDPIWAREMKRKEQPTTGRPRKSMIVVINTPRLRELMWWPENSRVLQTSVTDPLHGSATQTISSYAGPEDTARLVTREASADRSGIVFSSEAVVTPRELNSLNAPEVPIDLSVTAEIVNDTEFKEDNPRMAKVSAAQASFPVLNIRRERGQVLTEVYPIDESPTSMVVDNETACPGPNITSREPCAPRPVLAGSDASVPTRAADMPPMINAPASLQAPPEYNPSGSIESATDAVLASSVGPTVSSLQAELKALKKPGRRSNVTKAAMRVIEEQIAALEASENTAPITHDDELQTPRPRSQNLRADGQRSVLNSLPKQRSTTDETHSMPVAPRPPRNDTTTDQMAQRGGTGLEPRIRQSNVSQSQAPETVARTQAAPDTTTAALESPTTPQGIQDGQAEYEFHDDRPTAFTDDGRPRRGRRAGTTRQGGTVSAQRNKIILEAVHACGGVFPGNHEMCFVVMTAWQKRYQVSPDKQTVDRAIRNLLATSRLKKVTWTFADHRGFVHTRAVLTEPQITPHSSVVKEMQRAIEALLPVPYLPLQVDIFDSLRQQVAITYASKLPGESQEASTQGSSSRPRKLSFPEEDLLVQQTSILVEDAQAGKRGFYNSQTEKAYKASMKHYTHAFELGDLRSVNVDDRNDVPVDDDSDDMEVSGDEQMPFEQAIASEQDALQFAFMIPGYRHDASHAKHADMSSAAISRTLDRPFSTGLGARLKSAALNDNAPPVPVKVRQWRWYERRVTHPLNGGGEQWARARLLVCGMQPAFFAETGVFATRPYVPDTAQNEIRALQKEYFATHTEPAPEALRAPPRARIVPVPVAGDRASRSGRKTGTMMQEIASRHLHPTTEEVGDDDLFNAQEDAEASDRMDSAEVASTQQSKKRKRRTNGHERQDVDDMDDQDASDYVPPKRKRKYKTRVRKEKEAPVEKAANEKPRAHPPNKSGRRDRATAAAFKDTDRLVTAVALISAICGGTNQDRLSWTLISHALGFRYDGEFLRRRWQWPSRHRKVDVDQLRDAIREPFLRAYERGQLPRVDFHDLSQTDWPSLFRWVELRVIPTLKATSRGSDVPVLPSDRTHFDAEYFLETRESSSEVKKSNFFTSLTLEQRRHMAVGFLNSSPLRKPLGKHNGMDAPDILLKSWIRAVAMTKQNKYDAAAAGTKLSEFDGSVLDATIQEMVASRTLIQDKKGRHLPGRNFQIHSDCLQQFRRWPKQDEHLFLRMVAEARTLINDHFRYHDVLELVPTAQDTEYLVLANMVSQGFLAPIVTLPERNDDHEAPHPKLTMWSYGGYNYETKTANINSLKHPVAYMRLPSYRSEHELRSVPVPLAPPQFEGEADLRIAIWMDIHGNFIEDVWDMVLRSVLHCLVYRSGLTSESIEQAHAEKMWRWEIDILLGWMEQSGLAQHCGTGIHDPQTGAWLGGWRPSEWWYCAFLPEIAEWSVPRRADTEPILSEH